MILELCVIIIIFVSSFTIEHVQSDHLVILFQTNLKFQNSNLDGRF